MYGTRPHPAPGLEQCASRFDAGQDMNHVKAAMLHILTIPHVGMSFKSETEAAAWDAAFAALVDLGRAIGRRPHPKPHDKTRGMPWTDFDFRGCSAR